MIITVGVGGMEGRGGEGRGGEGRGGKWLKNCKELGTATKCSHKVPIPQDKAKEASNYIAMGAIPNSSPQLVSSIDTILTFVTLQDNQNALQKTDQFAMAG